MPPKKKEVQPTQKSQQEEPQLKSQQKLRLQSKPQPTTQVPIYAAWKAVEDIQGLDKISKHASKLLRLEHNRDIELNVNKEGNPRTILYSRTYNVESVLMQITGNEVETPCERCDRKVGPYIRCVIPQGADATTPCANCHYNSMGNKCSFVSNSDGDDGSYGNDSSDNDEDFDGGEDSHDAGGSDDEVEVIENPQNQHPQQQQQPGPQKRQKRDHMVSVNKGHRTEGRLQDANSDKDRRQSSGNVFRPDFTTPCLADEPASASGRATNTAMPTHLQSSGNIAGIRSSAAAHATAYGIEGRESAAALWAATRSTEHTGPVPLPPSRSHGMGGLAPAAAPARATLFHPDISEPWRTGTGSGLSREANRECARWHRNLADMLDREYERMCKEDQ